MCSKELLLLAFLLLVGGLHLTATATTTTFVAATSIGNHEMDRFLRDMNLTHIIATEDRILIDFYNYAFLNYTYKKENDELKKVSYSEEKARYGEGRINNVNGKLIHITDKDNLKDDTACSPNILATNGQEFPPQVIKWIALVRRGRCTFEEKVKNVYDRGAVGVIIYNDKEVNNLEKMQIKDQKRDITAVITYLDIGLEMANIIDQGLEMHVDITQGRSGSRPINNLNRTSVLFVSISFIVLMVISLVWLLFYYIQRFRYLQTKDQQSRQLCSVTKKAIMKIPTKTGKISDEKDIDSDCCAICIEAYKPSDCIRVLPCKHEFHKNCIDPWLIEHRTCPMCKLDVLKFYGFVVGDQIHSTPSPQHVPPNIATLSQNDVDVIVVALAPAQSSQSQQQQQQQQQHQHQRSPHSNALQHTQTQQPPLMSATTAHAQLEHIHPVTHNCNCSGAASSSYSDCNSSNAYSVSNCCNSSQQCNSNSNSNSNSCQQCCAHMLSANVLANNAAAIAGTNATIVSASGGGTNIFRRNSAPLVLEVSTASRQVTDV